MDAKSFSSLFLYHKLFLELCGVCLQNIIGGAWLCIIVFLSNAGEFTSHTLEYKTTYINHPSRLLSKTQMPAKRFLLDIRPRTVVYESLYVEQLHSNVNLLVSKPEDVLVVSDYIMLSKPEPDVFSEGFLCLTFSLSFFAEIKQEDLAENWLRANDPVKCSYTIMATDCFEVCGLVVGRVIEIGGGERKSLEFEDDYAERMNRNNVLFFKERKFEAVDYG